MKNCYLWIVALAFVTALILSGDTKSGLGEYASINPHGKEKQPGFMVGHKKKGFHEYDYQMEDFG